MGCKIVWFTGLSGTGKSTLSKKIYKILKKKKLKVLNYDGDIFRKKNKFKNSFTKKNIEKNNLLIIKSIKKKIHLYDFILVSVISPLIKTREKAKKTFRQNYFEVNTFSKLSTLIKRDTKGLYRRAKDNKLKNLIGYNSKIKYEKSKYSVTKINTDVLTVKQSTRILMKKIFLKK